MSTILEALRKLEREHSQRGSARALRAAVAAGGPAQAAPEQARWRAPLLALLLGAGLGAGLLLLWVGGREPADRGGAEAARTPADREAARASDAVIAVPRLVPALREISPQEFVPDVAVLERPPAPPRRLIEWSTGNAPPAPPASPRTRPVPPGPAAAAPSETARAPLPQIPPRPSTVSAVAEPPVAEPVVAAIPRATPLSVRVERTFWHPNPERRAAIVRLPGRAESLRVQEGEQLGALTVRRIEPSRVIFEREGIEVARSLEAR